jgi:hypothetical protein
MFQIVAKYQANFHGMVESKVPAADGPGSHI